MGILLLIISLVAAWGGSEVVIAIGRFTLGLLRPTEWLLGCGAIVLLTWLSRDP